MYDSGINLNIDFYKLFQNRPMCQLIYVDLWLFNKPNDV